MAGVPGRIRVVAGGQNLTLVSLKFGATNVPMFTDFAQSAQVTFPLTGVVADTTYYVADGWNNVQLDLVIQTAAGVALGTFSGQTGPGRELLFNPFPNRESVAAAVSVGGSALVVAPALTDAATVAWNVDNGNVFDLLATSGVGATRALGDPSGTSKDGKVYQLRYTQDAAGSRALTVSGAAVKIATALGGGTNVPLDTSTNAQNVITIVNKGGTYYVVSVARAV